MSDRNLVVAHFMDGRVLKGKTQDFFPNRDLFHLLPADGGPAQTVRCGELKAIYFVEDLAGDPARADRQGFPPRPDRKSLGATIAVRFIDGEILCGYATSYTAERAGFFLVPADPGSNNLRIYVVRSSTVAVKAGPGAEALVRQFLDPAA